MIAFEELVAALDRWRVRKGLPLASVEVAAAGAVAAPVVPATYVPAPAPTYAPPSRPTAAPAAAGSAVRPATDSDVLALGDDEMLDDAEADADPVAPPPAAPPPGVDEYDNEGDDYAMAFAGNPVGAVSGSIGGAAAPDEPTSMGNVDSYAAGGYGGGLDPAMDPAHDPAIDPDDEFAAIPPTPPPGYTAHGAHGAPAATVPEDTLDAGDEVLEEATVVGGDDHRR